MRDWEITLTPMTNEPPLVNFATFDTRNNRAVLDFDQSAKEAAIWTNILPHSYRQGGLIFEIYYSMTEANSGMVVWDVTLERMNVDELNIDSDRFTTPVAGNPKPINSRHGAIYKSVLALTDGTQLDGLRAGELFRARIRRLPCSNNALGDAELIAVTIRELR